MTISLCFYHLITIIIIIIQNYLGVPHFRFFSTLNVPRHQLTSPVIYSPTPPPPNCPPLLLQPCGATTTATTTSPPNCGPHASQVPNVATSSPLIKLPQARQEGEESECGRQAFLCTGGAPRHCPVHHLEGVIGSYLTAAITVCRRIDVVREGHPIRAAPLHATSSSTTTRSPSRGTHVTVRGIMTVPQPFDRHG